MRSSSRVHQLNPELCVPSLLFLAYTLMNFYIVDWLDTHIRSGNQSFRQTDLDLFGYSSQQACRVTLTNNLKGLVKQIAHISDYRVRSLMEHNTLYPFYAAFLSPIEIRKLGSATIEKRSGSILEQARVDLDSTSDRRKHLKFCPLCFNRRN